MYLIFEVSVRMSSRCIPHITSEICIPFTVIQYIIWNFSQEIAIYLITSQLFHSVIFFHLHLTFRVA
jgi:hypothetical protein